MTVLKLAGASALALAAATGASAQTHGGAPGFGALAYDGAAVELPVRAGGALSLEALGCWGYSSIEPTAAVDVAATGPLYLAAGSDLDLTLAVRGPDGEVSCADDEAGGFNPGLAFEAAEPGRYEIWIGTFGAGEGYPPTVLHANPAAFNTTNPFVVTPDADLPAGQTLRLSGGFRDDPRTLPVTAGGAARLSGLDAACYGVTSEAPAAALDYRGGALPLYLLLESGSDTTLAVVTPSGEVFCNDDAVDLNAGVRIETAEAGRYAIFAALLDETREQGEPATLSISEIGFGGVDRRLDVAGAPVFGEHALEAGFLPDPASFEVEAGGDFDLMMSLSEADAMMAYCSGFTTRQPSLRIVFDGDGPLYISMESEADTTLAINGPDGAWSCDDDGLGYPNPAVSYDAARAGVYDIYAATLSASEETAPATVYVSEIAPGADPYARMMDYSLEAVAATLSLAPGFDPEQGRFALTIGGDAQPSDTGGAFCTGHYTNAPSVELTWAGGPLTLFTEAETDTTLAVNLPDGSWACDDDGAENALSRLDLTGEAGVYDIWVGTYSRGETADAVLVLEDGGAQ